MSKEHSPAPVAADEDRAEDREAYRHLRRTALCDYLVTAVHLACEPRSAWRLIVMDAQMQIQVAKDAGTRWWEF